MSPQVIATQSGSVAPGELEKSSFQESKFPFELQFSAIIWSRVSSKSHILKKESFAPSQAKKPAEKN